MPTPTKSGGRPSGDLNCPIGTGAGSGAGSRLAPPARWRKFGHSSTSISGTSSSQLGHVRLQLADERLLEVVPERLLLAALRRAARARQVRRHVLRRKPDELERPVVLLERLGQAPLELQDQHLAAVDVVEDALQLKRVAPSFDRVGREVRGGTSAAPCEGVQHARAVPLDRIAEDHEDLRVRRGARGISRGVQMSRM